MNDECLNELNRLRAENAKLKALLAQHGIQIRESKMESRVLRQEEV